MIAGSVQDSAADEQVDDATADPGTVSSATVGQATTGQATADSATQDQATTVPTTVPTTTAPIAAPSTSATATPPTASGDFVTRDGTQLLLGGQPWKFVGMNAVYMLGCSNSTTAVDSIGNYFSSMGQGHVDRVWVLPGTDLAQVDRVVAAAKAAGSRVYFSLADANGACADPGGRKSADWYTGGWRATHEAHIRSVVTRYRDEPTVAFWELINESAGDAAAVRTFNDAAGALVKSVDANHLVESGTMPSYAFGGDGGWRTANGSAAVHITSIHEYDDETVESHWLLNALPLTQTLGKPVVVGEFGVEASPSGASCAHSYADRADLVARKLDAYLAHPEVAGANYWAYEGNVNGCDVGPPPTDTGLLTVLKAKAADL